MLDYRKCSDEKLAVLIKHHDKAAFAEIYDRFNGLLYIYSRKLTKNQDEAEDIIQEVFISLWDKRETLQLKNSFSSYLYSAVRYKFFDLVSRQKIRIEYASRFQLFIDNGENLIDHYMNEKELVQLIEKEVGNLPDKMREIFELSRITYLSHREIALHLKIAEKTVRNQINNALKKLRLRLRVFIFFIPLFCCYLQF